MTPQYPNLEFDEDPDAIIRPKTASENLSAYPARGVICFFQDVITNLLEAGKLRGIGQSRSEMGIHRVYEMTGYSQPLTILHPVYRSTLGSISS